MAMTFKHSILSLLVAGLLGCASGSDTNYPQQASEVTGVTAQSLAEKLISEQVTGQEEQPPVLITDLVKIPELNNYIDEALVHNPDLQQSISALRILYAQKKVTGSDRLPTLDATYSASREEESDDSYTGDLTVSWELDLWSRLSDSVAAADKDIASSQATLQETRDILVASLMRSWLEISLYQQLVEIETRRLDVLENNETLVLYRYQVGLGSLEDLDDARTNSASTRSALAGYQENLEKSKRSLILLTGQWNPEADPLEVPSQFPQVINPISELSDQSLYRRPDLKAAFYAIEAEELRTDAAYKAMLPSVSLSASLTSISETPSEALLVSPLWSLLGQISAPIFQGESLKSQAEIAELTTQQSFWAYQETLLNAVNEVENAAGLEYSLERQQQHLSDAFESAMRSSDNYKEKYRQGLVDILDLLTIQQKTYDTEIQLVNTIYERLINRIDLGLALGLGLEA